MRILHLSKGYYSYGGIEKVVRDWHQLGVRTRGLDSAVIAMDNRRGSERNVLTSSYVSLFKQPISLNYLVAYLRECNRFDIIHVHLPNYWAIFAVFLSRKGKKIVIHWHSDVVGKRLGGILRFAEYWVVSKADNIIFTSDSYLSSSYARHIAGKRAVVVPLTTSRTKNVINAVSKYHGKFLYLGRFVSYKGYELLFNAVLDLGLEKSFIFIGGSTEELASSMRSNPKYSVLDIRLEVSDNELVQIMESSKCLVLPSVNRAEAFGIAAIEALASGTPLITTELKGSGLNEINIDKKTGFKFDCGDIADLKEKIIQMSNIKMEQYQVLSNNSLERWKNHYSEEVLMDYIIKIYNNF